MSFSKLLRYQRHFRNFWRAVEEYLDLPRIDRLELDNVCGDIADDAGRLPLSRRVLTLAMGGADGADDIIAFCRRSPFVHCYEVDGKPYAVVPAVAVLNLSRQLKKGQASELPPPGPNKHDDPALRLAIETVELVEPWWSASTAPDDGQEPTTKSRDGRPKSDVARPKSSDGSSKSKDGRPKSEDGPSKSDVDPPNRHVGSSNGELDPASVADASRAHGRAGPDARPSKPNQTEPNRTKPSEPPARPPAQAPPNQPPPPPKPLDPRADHALRLWLAHLAQVAPTHCIPDDVVASVARDFTPEVFARGVENHIGDLPKWWQIGPIGALRKRCEWARDKPPTQAPSGNGHKPPAAPPPKAAAPAAPSGPRYRVDRENGSAWAYLCEPEVIAAGSAPGATTEQVEALRRVLVVSIQPGTDRGGVTPYALLPPAYQAEILARYRDAYPAPVPP